MTSDNEHVESTQNTSPDSNHETPAPAAFEPKLYFFYGSLMDPWQLTRVLGLRRSEPPVTTPASIIGYSCKMWGPYPAIVEGPPDGVVQGLAYKVQTQNAAAKLAYFETDAYEEHACTIYLEGGEKVSGMTFKWEGDADDEDLRDGVFSLREWQKGRR